MDRLPQELRRHISGFVPVDDTAQVHYVLDIDPVLVIEEMYEVGLDPVRLIADHTAIQETITPAMKYIVELTQYNAVSAIVSHVAGSGLTTFTYAHLNHRIDVTRLVQRISEIFPRVSFVESRYFSDFTLRDPGALFYEAYIMTSLFMTREKCGAYRIDSEELLRHTELRLTPEAILSTGSQSIKDEMACLKLVNQLVTLGQEPARLIAQRRLNQRRLRSLMADPRWELFQALDSGEQWGVWVSRSNWGDQLELKVKAKGDLFLTLPEITKRLGFNRNNVISGRVGFNRIVEPGFGLAHYLGEVAQILTAEIPHTINETFMNGMEMASLPKVLATKFK